MWTAAFEAAWIASAANDDGTRPVPQDFFGSAAERLVFVVAGDYYSHTVAQWPLWYDPQGNSTVLMTTPRMALAGDQPSESFASWQAAYAYARVTDESLVRRVRNAELYAEEQVGICLRA